jgi:diketogulonate reductase-like aldo/keto reductase
VQKIKTLICAELEYHPYVLSHLDPVLKIQEEHNIVTQSYGPLTPVLRHPGGPLKPVLTKIAKRLSADADFELDEASVLLLWTITKGVNPVTTSTKLENLKKMLTVSELPFLKDDEVEEIDRVGRTVYFRHYVSAYDECA